MMSSDEDEDHRYRVQRSSSAPHTKEACSGVRDTSRRRPSLRRVVSFRRKSHHHLHHSLHHRVAQKRNEEDCSSQISEGHGQLLEALQTRRLRLSIALTLWRRSPGELLEFLERLQDTSLLIHCLPALISSLQQGSAQLTVGFCVDLFPLVWNILQSPFEDFLITALVWIRTVLERWRSVLITDTQSSDYRNTGALKQALQDLWTLQVHFTSASETTAHIWKAIECHLIQL
ncbi:KATNB1-like protein 1 [Danio aesculapii]|uniref:KATNB1-like protein 1 n=1 Tax=Danio aesculapii TaxID=1142201 RepID=UPI0024C09FB5|nr:KATNB1-like protein 1 [Danio aesculapii]